METFRVERDASLETFDKNDDYEPEAYVREFRDNEAVAAEDDFIETIGSVFGAFFVGRGELDGLRTSATDTREVSEPFPDPLPGFDFPFVGYGRIVRKTTVAFFLEDEFLGNVTLTRTETKE